MALTPEEQSALSALDARLSAAEAKLAAAQQLAARSGSSSSGVARTDQDFRAGSSRDSASGDGAPDRRP